MMPALVTCREFVEFLDDYLSGALSATKRDEFNYHLSRCPACVTYLQSYQDAVRMGKTALAPSNDPVEQHVPEDLVQAILAARNKNS